MLCIIVLSVYLRHRSLFMKVISLPSTILFVIAILLSIIAIITFVVAGVSPLSPFIIAFIYFFNYCKLGPFFMRHGIV